MRLSGCLAIWVCLACLAAPVRAQETPARYSFDFAGQPLVEALTDFIEATHIGVIYASDLVSGKNASCVINNAPAEECLRCILAGTGLVFERYTSGTYLIKQAPTMPGTTQTPPPGRKSTVSGYVRDANSGESLIGAAVFEIDRKAGATSNSYGFYSLTLPAGPARFVVSYLGFEQTAFEADLSTDREINIDLVSSSINMDTLVVEGARIQAIEATTQMSVSAIPISQILAMPALLGEVDVLRAIQLMPGVQSGNEGSTGLYVRGGSPDQNLILIDGAPVYNASHLFGFLSVFNADAMRNVQLTKGGFPARYGGRLSSVLEMSMKEGNDKRYAGEVSLGVVSAHALLEGPIVRNRSSFMVAARRSFVDLVARPFDSDLPGYFLYDVNAKVNHTFSQRDRVYISYYGGADRFGDTQQDSYSLLENTTDSQVRQETEYRLGWGNTLGTLRWNHLFSPKLFSNVLLLTSDYHFDTFEREETRFVTTDAELSEESRLRYASGVRDLGGRVDFEYQPNPDHYIRFGASGTWHRYLTGTLQYRERLTDATPRDTSFIQAPRVEATEWAAYVEDDIQLSPALSANAGLHASAFDVDAMLYASLEPRLSIRWLVGSRWALKASYARMTQYLHLLTNAGIGLPTDLWVPSTAFVKPQRSQQVALGLARTLPRGYEISIEGYYKIMRHLIEYSEGASFLGVGKGWQQNVSTGRGRSYGVEWLIHKKTGQTTGWIGYTLAWSDRTFADLNFGRTFPYKFDRRHDIAATLQHSLSERWKVAASWVFGSGNAITLPTARYLAGGIGYFSSDYSSTIDNNTQYDVIEQRNGFRMRAYHRFDAALTYAWEKPARTNRLSLSVFNAYNRKNPYFYYRDDEYSIDPNGGPGPEGLYVRTTSKIKQQSLFPILPSISYHVSF